MKVLLLLVNLAIITAMSEFIHEYYVITTRCNVTNDDVIEAVRSVTHCGAMCLGHSDCSGFHYVQEYSGTCHMYGEHGMMGSSSCSEGDPDVADIYVQQNLASEYNMTWTNITGSHGNNTDDDNSGVTTCANGGTYDVINKVCNCIDGWVRPRCENLTGDCSTLQQTGEYPTPGIYTIHPSASPSSFKVFCFMTPTFGLTQIQAHMSDGLSFNRTWADYKAGFTYNPELTNSWLGNDYIHYITISHPQNLLLDIKNGTFGTYQYKQYGVMMAAEEGNYSISYNSYGINGIPRDPCLPKLSYLPFSTFDRDNDGDPDTNCAALHGAGWWFESQNNCTQCNLNGDITRNQHTREGRPEEAFVLPIDPDFSPEYILMALYWLP